MGIMSISKFWGMYVIGSSVEKPYQDVLELGQVCNP
jgi:hypothetical protein